jgi:non-specific serine/threonine protein kinase
MAVHNLPYAAAPFVNRVSEVAEITHLLNSADCRLLTLVGPGGIGKTRLVTRVATNCAEQFDDGVYFVPLQSLASPEFIVSRRVRKFSLWLQRAERCHFVVRQ